MTDLTEQALEDAMVEIMGYPELDLAPRYLVVAPHFVGLIVAMQHERWKRSAYLRRRRGWAPK